MASVALIWLTSLGQPMRCGRRDGRRKRWRRTAQRDGLGVGVGAHAALFDDHVSLFVKLAGHGVGQAAAFEIRPELQAVLWHGPEELGVVEASFGVQALGSVALAMSVNWLG